MRQSPKGFRWAKFHTGFAVLISIAVISFYHVVLNADSAGISSANLSLPKLVDTQRAVENVDNKSLVSELVPKDSNDDESPNQVEGPVQVHTEFQNLGYQDPREEPTNEKQAFKTPFGQIIWKELAPQIYASSDGALMANYRGFKLKLTLNKDLQESTKKNLDAQRNIAGATVIIESRTGKILALSERKSEIANPLVSDDTIAIAAKAPAASLMKIITATAAIEKTGMDPDDEIAFRGGCGHLRNQNWIRDSATDRQKLTLAKAFGNSCNTAFARVALYWTGLSTLRQYAEKYMFNKPIPSDLRMETSAALMPQLESASALEVGEAGAGFGASKLTPIHAALISATAGNGGVMMAPYLVEAAFDQAGKQVYTAAPREISRVFSKKTSEKLFRCMQETILTGTSRKFFRRRGTARDRFEIGGKTGTLSDAEERATLYTWFSGVAPLDSPHNVAIGTLIASPKNWVVRASSVAQTSLARFLMLEKQRDVE